MWQNSALLVGVIFASAWGVESEVDIVLHEGAKKRYVPSQLDVDEGTFFTLKCTLAPPLLEGDLVWKSIGNFHRTESDELSFQPVRLEDTGEYLCLDRKGNMYKSVVINVAPRPQDLSPPLKKLYEDVRKIAEEEKQNDASPDLGTLLNSMREAVSENEDLLKNLTEHALRELQFLVEAKDKVKPARQEDPLSESLPSRNGRILVPKNNKSEHQKNLVGVSIPHESYLNDEGYLNDAPLGGEEETSNFKETTTQNEVEIEEKLTVAPSLAKDANEDDSKTSATTAADEDEGHETVEEISTSVGSKGGSSTGNKESESTTTTKMDEYVEDLYDDYEESEAGDATSKHEEEVTAKDNLGANAANFKYTVDKNENDGVDFFNHHEPNELFNRFGGKPIDRIPIGLEDIYADYMNELGSVPKEHETVEGTELPMEMESKTSRKDWAAINLNDFNIPFHENGKALITEAPEHDMEFAPPTEATTVQSMESTVNKINREVYDMMLFKYIVYALLLILVILLLAFIIRIWHLLEYKPSNDYSTPATHYVKMPQPVTIPTVEDGTESLLP